MSFDSTNMSSPVLASYTSKHGVTRKTVKCHHSIWGDQFLSYDERDNQGLEEQEAKELVNEVRKELLFTGLNEPMQHVKQIQLIDTVQRLGLDYHFEAEIEESLNQIYVIYGNRGIEDMDLEITSLWFRLLRQHGFNISSEIFKKYMYKDGSFMESLRDNVQGMLSLYEAAYMGVEEEEILNAAIEFTTFQLESIAKNHLCNKPALEIQIKQALRQPLRKRLPRLEALRYIPIYQQAASHNENLLRLAKLDFNLLQSLHKKELSEITKWWKHIDTPKKLPYVRDRLVEGYFWLLGIYIEPKFSYARIYLNKTINFITIIDDTYDNYGTYEELEIFTEAVQRWSASCLDMLPEYMKIIYRELLNVHKEAEELLQKKGLTYRSYYIKEMVKEFTRCNLTEAKWAKEGYIPTVEEHMSVTLVTGGYPVMIAKSYVFWDDLVTEETFKWLSTSPPIVNASSSILRLMNDVATHKEEREKNHIPSSIECFMKKHGVSEEETCEIFSKQIEDWWKVINQESLMPTVVTRPLLMPPINLARACDVIYKHNDNYTHAGNEMIECVKLLLVNPIV